MHFREFVDSVQSIIAVTELVKNDSKDGTAPMADFLYSLKNAGISMDYDKFKTVYDSNPALKNVIQQFDAETVTFVGGEPQADAPAGDIPPDEKVGKMAKRAMNKRESVEEAGLPPHLAKMFDKYGNFKDPKKQAKFDAMQKKEREKKQMKWVDVTPKGYGPVDEATNVGINILNTMERIVDEKSAMEVKFLDGKSKVDMYTASAFMQVYNKVNDANQKKMLQMAETRTGFVSLMKKVFKMISGVKEGKSPHKKGTAKYKKHMAAMHAGESVAEAWQAFKEAMDGEITKDSVKKSALELLVGIAKTSKQYKGKITDDQVHYLGSLVHDFDMAGIETEKYSEIEKLFRTASKTNKADMSMIQPAYAQAKTLDEEAVEEGAPKMKYALVGTDMKIYSMGSDERDLRLDRRSLEKRFPDAAPLKMARLKTAQRIGDTVDSDQIKERSLTKAEKEKMKHYEKKLDKAEFKKRYGKEGEAVYYATATKMAKKNA